MMRMLLVDDHPLFLEGLENFLKINNFDVIGAVRNGAEAIMKCEMLQPDLILMDLQMADCDGLETTRIIKKEYPAIMIVMLTAMEDEDSLFASLQAGASGYLLKTMEPEYLLKQLSGLSHGDMPLAPNMAKRLLTVFTRQKQIKAVNRSEKNDNNLTKRQFEILKFVTAGLTYREIAHQLGLKEVTIKYHINEILTKLHLANRTQLITYASHKGWV